MLFTDWDENLHTTSVRTFSYKDTTKQSLTPTKFEDHIAEAIWLYSDYRWRTSSNISELRTGFY